MSNQWGRSGGGAGGRTGSGTSVLAIVASLAIGAAGGYGAVRTLQSFDARNLAAESEARVSELTAEIARLRDTAEDRSGAREKLAEDNAALRRQVEALRRSIDTSEAVLQADNVRLRQETVPALEADLRAAQRAAREAEAARSDLAQQLDQGRARLSDLQARLAESERALEASRRDGRRAADAERLARLDTDLRRITTERDRLGSELAALKERDIPALESELAKRQRRLDDLRNENRALAERLRQAERSTADATPSRPDDSGMKPAPVDRTPADTQNPRDAALVKRALGKAPGLARLSSGDLTRLERGLVDGECVTAALDAVFDRVPVLALRNLMRDLDSDC
ncbi:hypothetical protein LXM94_01555 [Rhizobium sp. TRM95111]|uniref:hypothetical protein n=1 Tax=Rhizobium alarense TaxID=2846851 RepID=UPI001F35FEFC|nr:hypothetical protein [Rhizobium alarense]MCF3638656.1 hypothetical protein [Rhizobium alarense]